MTAINLKKKIVSKLNSTTEMNVLEAIIKLLDVTESEQTVKLNKKQLEKVKIAKKQYKVGKVKTHAAANKDIVRWLGK